MENYGNLSPTEIARMLQEEWLKGQGTITQLPGKAAPSVQKYYSTHKGYDIGVPQGTPVYAPAKVEVLGAGLDGGYGQRLAAYLADRNQTAYLSHLSQIAVQPGTYEAGTLLGYTGGNPGSYGAGNTTGAHIDFELASGRGSAPQHTAPAYNIGDYAQKLLQTARQRNPQVVAISSDPAKLEEMRKRGLQIVKMTI